MGLIIRILIGIAIILSVFKEGQAAWQGPSEIISVIWGTDVQQFGLESGDSGDTFPLIEAITPDNKIVITDMVNKKQVVFNLDGTFIKEVKWTIKSQSGGITYYDISEYSFGPVVGYSSNGNIYTGSGGKYYLKSPTGQLLQTYTSKPAELGKVKETSLGGGKYKVTVTYPDKEWGITRDGTAPRYSYIKDMNGNLYGVGNTQIVRFNNCGKEAAKLIMPETQYQGITLPAEWPPEAEPPRQEVIEEYGSPVLAPNGDVYAWKRTPTKYSILKWTWQDDANAPANTPDAPTSLKASASTTGITLTWKASPQDPGCVTGYEIVRSLTSGSGYSTLSTVAKGTAKYEDTTTETGTTYYYKIRSVGGDGYSDYSNEVSGKK